MRHFYHIAFAKQPYGQLSPKLKWWVLTLAFLTAAVWGILQLPLPDQFIQDSDWGHQLSGAYQVMFGEHPFIDYHTTYGPLTFYASAFVQVLFDSRIIGEMLLITLGFSVGYTMLFLLMWRVSGRLWLTTILCLLALIMIPRLYKYYLIFTPAFSLLTIWNYAENPGWRSKWLLAVAAAMTGLFRQDFGVFVALPMFLAILRHPALTRRRALLDCLWFILFTIICASPWFIWAALRGGLNNYFFDSLHSVNHASGVALPFPSFDWSTIISANNAAVSLFIFFYSLPVISLVTVLLKRSIAPISRIELITASMMAQLLLVQSMHRSDYSHLLQSIPIHFILWVFLFDTVVAGLQSKLSYQRVGSALGGSVLLVAVVISLYKHRPLDAQWLREIQAMPETLKTYASSRDDFFRYVEDRYPEDPYVKTMIYIRECTGPNERLLGLPLLPNFNYLVERPFGGGQMAIVPGYFTDQQQAMIDRMEREPVSIIVYYPGWVLDNREDGSMKAFAPKVWEYIEEQYVTVKSYEFLEIRIRRTRARDFVCN